MWTGKPYGTQVDFEGKLERMLADPSEPEPLDLSSARCIVLFHGQSANVAHERKVIPFYKAIMQKLSKQPTSSEHPAFLFAFDYRGFGTSTGTPTEKGLIQDGISAVNVILERLRISPRHVTLVGHSLGSAVATATYKYFVVNRFRREAGMGEIKTPPESLGGLLASAPFADAPRAIRQWREYFGIEVRPYLFGHSIYLEHHLPDKWNNIEALDEIGRESHIWDVTIAHAKDDPNIYDQNSKDMYTTLVNTQDAELAKEIKKRLKSLPPNEEKPHIESETFGDQKRASLILTPKGGMSSLSATTPLTLQLMLRRARWHFTTRSCVRKDDGAGLSAQLRLQQSSLITKSCRVSARRIRPINGCHRSNMHARVFILWELSKAKDTLYISRHLRAFIRHSYYLADTALPEISEASKQTVHFLDHRPFLFLGH